MHQMKFRSDQMLQKTSGLICSDLIHLWISFSHLFTLLRR